MLLYYAKLSRTCVIERGEKTLTKLLRDILEEPDQLTKSLEYNWYEGRTTLEEAARLLREAKVVYIVGIGSSWHAGMAVLSIFHALECPALLMDASFHGNPSRVRRHYSLKKRAEY